MKITRIPMPEYPWEQVEAAKGFMTRLFSGHAVDRPGCLVHPAPLALPEEAPPAGLNEGQLAVWRLQEALRRRPLGGDDFVPALGTGAGTCAMATAFGCKESEASGVYWVEPCITRMEEIDALTSPSVGAGKLGWVLEQTRAYAAYAEERVAIRVMDFQSPFTTVEQMLGSDRFFLMPYDEPGRLHRLMDVVTDYAIAFFTAQIEAAGPNACPGIWPPLWYPRIAGIQMSDDNLVNVSPEVYEEFVVPYNSRIAQALGGLFLHSCTIKEACLPALKQIKGLTGINCDISTSVSPARLMEEFPDLVIAPHAYINTDTNFHRYAEYMEYVLRGWTPGKQLFIYPCTVLYQPDTSREIRFNEAEARAVLERIPGWARDHGMVFTEEHAE
ncbi:MAG: methylcobalamin:coenzyme M methyltransferase [bacterium ADurb.Bin429]|nr:MAG: methylcobalamin:coenzyme M methyltransferase [bacterium ADurb.Bin429]